MASALAVISALGLIATCAYYVFRAPSSVANTCFGLGIVLLLSITPSAIADLHLKLETLGTADGLAGYMTALERWEGSAWLSMTLPLFCAALVLGDDPCRVSHFPPPSRPPPP